LGASRRPGSPVFALHLLVRERSWLERDSGDARFSILGAIIEHSPAGMELESDLGGIGARIAWQDNPFIPMDDYLLNPAWAFVRLEAPAEAAREAVGMFVDFLREAAIDEAAIAAAAARVRMELGVRTGRPVFRLHRAANEALFGDYPYGRGVFPAEAGTLDPADYGELLARIRLGGNLIVTATGPAPGDETLDLLENVFGGLPAGGGGNRNKPIAFEAAARIERRAAIEGVYIRRAWLAADVEAGEAAALQVGAEVLGRRMQEEIRETRGLAYSTGCGASLYPGAVVVSATIGSRADNLAEVAAVLDSLIRSLTTSPPTDEETAAAKSRLRGRLARRHLSSASEAAALGVELFLFPEAVAGNRLAAVDAPAVRDALARRIDPDGGVTVRLLPGEGERPVRRMPPPGMPGMR
ncbi:MAG TPA: insulinase family protein, partial [Alphaproteobacteria bacterium]|nr:insulinase family protein [Alphaproteobacteria bacterium]